MVILLWGQVRSEPVLQQPVKVNIIWLNSQISNTENLYGIYYENDTNINLYFVSTRSLT